MLEGPRLPLFGDVPVTPAGKPLTKLQPIAEEIWNDKYRFKKDGIPVDMSVADTWSRVATTLSIDEDDKSYWRDRFYDVISDYRFMPAGRIIAGAGTGYNVTMYNCFVLGKIDDSMPGIFQALKESALTLQQGGGIGNDFSSLRPKGAVVDGVGALASGPLTFMDCWDTMCRTIMGGGTRRGAMMGTMRCDHPDIEAFVEAKRDPTRFRNFNLSVLVTDAFVEAARNHRPWKLVFAGKVYKEIEARALWNKILQATYDCAEPGVIFIDRINQMNNLNYCEDISCCNPCAEQPLPAWGACLLGSLNLAVMVDNPFEETAQLNIDKVVDTVKVAVRMLDNVIDVSNYPLPQQEQEAKDKRRMGLGVTGLADALAMCRLRYGSDEAAAVVSDWMRVINETAYLTSSDLAIEKGSFPLFDADKYCYNLELRGMPSDLVSQVREYGIRNSHLTSIAPTGTISQFAGNVSSGVEPIFAFEYDRKRLLEDGSKKTSRLRDFAVDLYAKQNNFEGPLGQYQLPDYFVPAHALTPSEHLKMLAAVQKHVDSSVSKTVNVPEDISFEDFKSVYDEAYNLGLKCCATYRPNDITGSILSLPVVEQNMKEVAEGLDLLTNPPERAEELPGVTYKLKWPTSDHAMYVTINDVIEDGKRRPYEVFINSKNMEHYAWIVGLTRMVSAVFRRGGDVRFVVEELKAIFDPHGGAWVKSNGSKTTKYVPSVLAHIGETIEKHMIDIGFMETAVLMSESMDDVPVGTSLRQCPRCGGASIVREEGCDRCLSCTYTKCG